MRLSSPSKREQFLAFLSLFSSESMENYGKFKYCSVYSTNAILILSNSPVDALARDQVVTVLAINVN